MKKVDDGVQALHLPAPGTMSGQPFEALLRARRSVREYSEEALTVAELSQLLWAGQGIVTPEGFRTAPSAGALYPLEIHVAVSRISTLAPAVYHYLPHRHALARAFEGDAAGALAAAAYHQASIVLAAAVVVLSAVPARTWRKYGERGSRYVHMEVGHAAQNVWLQAVALGLAAVVVGAFHDAAVRELLDLPEEETPLYLMPIGRPVPTS